MRQTILNRLAMDRFDEFWDAPEGGAMTEDQRWAIADLMENVTLYDQEIDQIRLFLWHGPSAIEAAELIDKLVSRLPDPVTERGRYNQRDLNNHLKKLI